MFKIVSFEEKYLDEMAKLFSLSYSDDGGIYPTDLAKKRLEDDLKSGVNYSFVAIDENKKLLGGIICKKQWGEAGWELNVDTVQVYPEFQKQGIGRQLVTAAVEKAKKDNAAAACFPVDVTDSRRVKWYESMGFVKLPQWVFFWSKINDIKI